MSTKSLRKHLMWSLGLSLGLSCALASLPAAAATIYKCKVNGKITYDDKPCDTGEQTSMKVAETPEPPPKKKLVRKVVEYEEVDDDAAQPGAVAPAAVAPGVAAAAQPAAKAGAVSMTAKQAPRDLHCEERKIDQRAAEARASSIGGPRGDNARIEAKRTADRLALSCPG